MKIKVNVKWNKELYKDIEVDLEEPPEMFKIQLMSLTGVPLERQKVLTKGGRLGDGEWGKVVLKDGMTIMMMGTADVAKLPDKAEEPQFVEDLPERVTIHRPLCFCSRISAKLQFTSDAGQPCGLASCSNYLMKSCHPPTQVVPQGDARSA